MTPAEKKLANHLLSRASEEFGNHGCNDLELVRDVGLTPEESFEIRQSMHVWLDDPERDAPRPDRHYTMDWLAMKFIAKRVQQVPDDTELLRLARAALDQLLPPTNRGLIAVFDEALKGR